MVDHFFVWLRRFIADGQGIHHKDGLSYFRLRGERCLVRGWSLLGRTEGVYLINKFIVGLRSTELSCRRNLFIFFKVFNLLKAGNIFVDLVDNQLQAFIQIVGIL